MEKIKFALVGCGRISKKHAETLTKHLNHKAELIAVSDPQGERAKIIGEKYGIPYYKSYDEMLTKHPEIQVVNILTESGNHAKHTVDIVKKYKKHIVTEKPMALTLEDADEMIRVCDENGVKLYVVKQNRYNLPVMKLREALENGKFGKLVMGSVRVRWCRPQEYYDQDAWRGTWAMDGGVFTNQASHHIDLLEWMLGEPISVFAKSRTALANIETEDTGVAIITFKNGAIGVVEATTATRPKDLEGSLSILGEKGTVVNATPPYAVAGGNVETSQRIVDVLLKAFAEIIPEKIPAACQGTMNNITIGGIDPRTDKPFTFYETIGGGFGARFGLDGIDGIHSHMTNTMNTPIEEIEKRYPIMILKYSLRPNSGGLGKWRGGLGIERVYKVLTRAILSVLGDRHKFPPWGLRGGLPGAPGEYVVIRKNGETIRLGSKDRIPLNPGDVVIIRTPGGGGYGNPVERSRDRYLEDILDEKYEKEFVEKYLS